MRHHGTLSLNLRTQHLTRDSGGHAVWEMATTRREVLAHEVAIVICDMWDNHWSRGASERVALMAPHMNEVIRAARQRGVRIIHAPSDTLAYYAAAPARQRIAAVPLREPPPDASHIDPPLPIDASDHGSDTSETETRRAWTRQHPAIEIDQDRDVISDDGCEIYGFLVDQGVEQLLIMGVHTNICVLNRSFGIKQMTRWGVDVALVRDLTDTMYNPAMPPYVSHDEGTRLVVSYIEKFWCPTISSEDLIGRPG